MFIYNLKLSKKTLKLFFICISAIIISLIMIYSIYIIFFKTSNPCELKQNDIIDLNETNYTNFLKSANEDISSYIDLTVRVTGYVYRLIDFNKSQFVVARDMRFRENPHSIIVGFLCEYKDAPNFSDGTWVEVVGKIKKGRFYDELAVLDIISIKETNQPENIFVNPPDNTYIPTTNNMSFHVDKCFESKFFPRPQINSQKLTS